MSVHVSSWAWQQEIGDDGAKLVLLKLADQANDHGVAWPKRETLLSECEAGHEDTIKARMRRLRDLGLVISVPWFAQSGRQTSSMHVVLWRGVPSADRLWEILATADRKGSPAVTLEELRALEALGAFLRGGASVHPLPVSGGASDHPGGGVAVHPSIEEPALEPSTEEPDGSSVPADAGEREVRKFEISLTLTAELGAKVASMTRSERGAWERAITDLVDVGATAGQVHDRCVAYRERWPEMTLTALALARHWTSLGVDVEQRQPSGFDAWLDKAPSMFDRQTAHEVIEDNWQLDVDEAKRRHELIDRRYDNLDERSNAA